MMRVKSSGAGLLRTSCTFILTLLSMGVAAACAGPEAEPQDAEGRLLSQQSAALVTSAGADPAVRPGFSWVPAVTPPATHWVNNVTGDDSRVTPTESLPWRTINKAVGAAPAGSVIYVQNSGVPYREHVQLSRAGSATARFMLVGVPYGTHTDLPEWRDEIGVNQPQVKFTSSYWIVKGFLFNKVDSTHNSCVRMSGSDNALIEVHCHGAHGVPAEHAISIAGSNQLVRKSKSYDNLATGCTSNCDLHGFRVGPGSKRIVLQQNEAWNNSGDGVQCMGSESDATLGDAEDVWIEDHRLHDNKEQAVDIKSCNRVTVAGTDGVDGSKFYAQAPGGAMVIHFKARNILIEKTRFWNNSHGVNIGSYGTDHDTQNIVLRRNLFFDFTIDPAQPGTQSAPKGYGILMSKVTNVDIYHNTFDNMPGGGIYVGFAAWTGSLVNASSNVHIWNNIFNDVSLWAIKWRSAYGPGFSSKYNLYHRDAGAAVFDINHASKSFAAWKAESGQDTVGSSEQSPQFVTNPQANDYYTLSTSPARNAALDDTGQPRPCAGTQAPPDIGFKETCT
ncbi:hypothetical protein D7W79_01735 [Corallococcus exercitus]|uniref:right-handed parallel beta-helix repeat-containing protein n=1 Tax=Corallococcus exercitus TaxID=2316736 RepID=UPI000EA1C5CD|nr:right-handed parallel beta-helix repeat-containing protein [Corallococcus exercitus]RKG82748.1 hypothetical protein D7W79_01735 [Corallococcus exercitus]